MKRVAARRRGRLRFGIANAVAIMASHATSAQTPPPYGGDLWTRPALTGDWGGVRDDWAKNGVTFSAN